LVPRGRAVFARGALEGPHRLNDDVNLVHSLHVRECTKFSSGLAARYRRALQKVCAASERRRQSIITCERRRRTNVLSAWNVVPSSAATGLSPAVHSPSRTMDLQSPQRTSVETCRQTSHGEHDVESSREPELEAQRGARSSCWATVMRWAWSDSTQVSPGVASRDPCSPRRAARAPSVWLSRPSDAHHRRLGHWLDL